MDHSHLLQRRPNALSRAFKRAVLEGAERLDRDDVRALADQLHTLARQMGEPLTRDPHPCDDGRCIWL